ERQLHLALADPGARKGPVVLDVQDVGAHLGDGCGEPGQRAGPVGEHHRQADEPAVLHEAALDDSRHHRDVDVAAGEDEGDRPPVEAEGAVHEAASVVAPAPSTTVFSISSRSRIALAISSSETVTTSSTSAWITGAVSAPRSRTAMPSAIVGSSAARTPIRRTRGPRALTAVATPAMSPPPPRGIRSASASGR